MSTSESGKISEDLRKDLHDRAWAYFDRHAEQRLKTFHFFLLLCTAAAAALVTISSRENGLIGDGWVGLFLVVISAIFWKLDVRNRDLLRVSENAIKELEGCLPLQDEPGGLPNKLKLFRREKAEQERECNARQGLSSIFTAHYSYRNCFSFTFLAFGLVGVVIAISCVWDMITGSIP